MDLSDWMRGRGGVAHTSGARAAGFSAQTIADAVRAGELRRVRRSWLVAPDCDARRVAAASVSGRVTCVSAAQLHGLWVPAHELVHVAVGGGASRFDRTGMHVHWGRGPAPVARDTVDDPILNVLFHVADCLPRADSMAVWESALRKGLVDPVVLERVAWRSARAAELASIASGLSDSGTETRFLDLMRRAGIPVRQQVWIDGHPVDGLIGDALVVQLDGFAHHSEARDRRRDIRADARLVMRGLTVFRFDYYQVWFEEEEVVGAVQTAIAQGLHRIRRSR